MYKKGETEIKTKTFKFKLYHFKSEKSTKDENEGTDFNVWSTVLIYVKRM